MRDHHSMPTIWESSRNRLLRPLTLAVALTTLAGTLEAANPILVGAGDIAKCGGTLKRAEATASLLDQVVAQASRQTPPQPVVVFTLGDAVYPRGREKEFRKCYEPTWGRHLERTRPAIGNHEYGSGRGEAFFEYFGEAAGPPGLGYYSYDLGNWHIVVLNSACRRAGGCEPESTQYQWLEQDLKQNGRRCTLAYFHHPLWSTGPHGQKNEMQPLYELLYEFGVEAALAGHDHHYERFAPQDPSGAADPRGVRQFVVGTGGRGGRWFLRERPRGGPNSEVARSGVFGVLKLELQPDAYTWEFLSIDKSFQDSGSQGCH